MVLLVNMSKMLHLRNIYPVGLEKTTLVGIRYHDLFEHSWFYDMACVCPILPLNMFDDIFLTLLHSQLTKDELCKVDIFL